MISRFFSLIMREQSYRVGKGFTQPKVNYQLRYKVDAWYHQDMVSR